MLESLFAFDGISTAPLLDEYGASYSHGSRVWASLELARTGQPYPDYLNNWRSLSDAYEFWRPALVDLSDRLRNAGYNAQSTVIGGLAREMEVSMTGAVATRAASPPLAVTSEQMDAAKAADRNALERLADALLGTGAPAAKPVPWMLIGGLVLTVLAGAWIVRGWK
jgi:hypothetical protein